MNASVSSNDPWVVFDYEVDMFRNLCVLLDTAKPATDILSRYIKNAIVESTVLHTRILVGILLSDGPESDDIKLTDLMSDFSSPKVDQLREMYGKRNDDNSPRWTFNKMLAHATRERTASFDYSALLNLLAPVINSIVDQINAERS